MLLLTFSKGAFWIFLTHARPHDFDGVVMSVSMFIWCEKDVSFAKIKLPDGSVIRGYMNDSVGPAKHVLTCVRDGCRCTRWDERMEEIGKEE